MKLKPLLLLALALPLMACKPATTTAPLAPGYLNTADQTMGEILVGAHNFYSTIQSDIAAGKYTPGPVEKTSLNNFATALNVAQQVYIAYHNGQATQASAQAAVNAVSTQQTALQQTITGGTQ